MHCAHVDVKAVLLAGAGRAIRHASRARSLTDTADGRRRTLNPIEQQQF